MLIKRDPSWRLPEGRATPEAHWLDRRRWLAAAGFLGLGALAAPALLPRRASAAPAPIADLFPAARNPAFDPGRPLTEEAVATSYNNFYEFGTSKDIVAAAQRLEAWPWTVTIDGLVEAEQTLDAEQLVRRMPLEERLYRFRCVEAWAMTVPWTGFPLAALVSLARPLGSARYLRMETFMNPEIAPGQRQSWYPWPYVEGLTLAEATHDLAFIATGIYGKPLPDQNGAPLRLVVPWKYGFKNIKSIVRFTFTDQRPTSYWEQTGPSEYGFWANVNPEVPHPRWSQASERLIGTAERVPTRKFNGYEAEVAGLYADLGGEALFK